jgi:hypothetical protein
MLNDPDPEESKRVMNAMLQMRKIDSRIEESLRPATISAVMQRTGGSSGRRAYYVGEPVSATGQS